MESIIVRRQDGEDASQVAKRAAEENNTSLEGNLRWYGAMGAAYREIGTADGRTIRIVDPDSLDPRAV